MEWLELVLYSVPALLVMGTAYLVLQQQGKQQNEKIQLELRAQQGHHTLPIRLQAYERLALFLERSEFNNLIPRIRDADMTASELQYALITAIRSEYEHNLTQQIYVSANLWRSIAICKDEMIKTINLVAATMKEDATGNDLSRALFQYVIDSEEPMPTQKVLAYLKQEAAQHF